MALPASPINGQQAIANGILYTYDSTKNAWNRTTAGNISVTGNITAGGNVTAAAYFWANGTPLSTGGSTYGNTEVAAYLPTNSTILDLYSNAATQATSINSINANLGAYQAFANANAASQSTSISSIDANLGTATTNITTLFSNAATQATSINSINANLGAFQTYANANIGTIRTNLNTLDANVGAYQTFANSNASTQATSINSINANIGAFITYANTKIGTNSNSNLVVPTATATTSSTTGALVVGGGVGVSGAVTIASNTTIGQTTLSPRSNLFVHGGNLSATVGSSLTIAEFSTTNTNGSYLQIKTNRFAQGADWTTANTRIQLMTDVTPQGYIEFNPIGAQHSVAIGSIGTEIVRFHTSTGNVVFNSTATSTSTTSGAIVVRGGAGIAGALYIANTGDVSANIGTIRTNLNTLDANVGAYETWANLRFTTLDANLGTATTNITTLFSNAGTQATSINTINANLGSYQIYANANLGTATTNIGSLQANLGAYQTFANANAATQTTSINTINANLGSFQTYSNSKIGTNSNSSILASTIYTSSGIFWSGNGAAYSSGSSPGGGITYTASATPPAGPVVGDKWYDTSTDVLFEYTNDGTSTFWLDIGSPTLYSNATVTGSLLSISGNATVANLSVTSRVTSDLIPTGNVVYNVGSPTAWWGTFYGISTQAKYADLAENYQSDQFYKPGTVVVFGGTHEITTTTISHDSRVAGVISTNPAYLMNADAEGLPVAFTGRVPCFVQGPVNKGDILVTSSSPGVAKVLEDNKFRPGCVIGKSLEKIEDTSVQLIEIAVGRY